MVAFDENNQHEEEAEEEAPYLNLLESHSILASDDTRALSDLDMWEDIGIIL